MPKTVGENEGKFLGRKFVPLCRGGTCAMQQQIACKEASAFFLEWTYAESKSSFD